MDLSLPHTSFDRKRDGMYSVARLLLTVSQRVGALCFTLTSPDTSQVRAPGLEKQVFPHITERPPAL